MLCGKSVIIGIEFRWFIIFVLLYEQLLTAHVFDERFSHCFLDFVFWISIPYHLWYIFYFLKNYLSTNVFNWEYVCIIYYLLSFISFLSQIMGSYSIFMFLPCHSSESSLKGQNFCRLIFFLVQIYRIVILWSIGKFYLFENLNTCILKERQRYHTWTHN